VIDVVQSAGEAGHRSRPAASLLESFVTDSGFPGPSLKAVARIPAPSRRTFEREVGRLHRPVILEGVTDGWPAIREWSFDFIIEKYGDCRWNVILKEDGGYTTTTLYGCDHPVPVGEHLRKALKHETEDYLSVELKDLQPKLAAMVPQLPFAEGARHQQRGLFIGTEVNVAPLHFHLCQNVLTQIFGAKRVLLFPFLQARNLGWQGPFSGNLNFLRMDPFAPTARDCERYRNAVGYAVDLRPGDSLYIPIGWWHATRTLSPSISLFDRWASGWRCLPTMATNLFDSFMGLVHRLQARPR
jgi:hypothetical protein